jgi:phosphatidylserine/phosphatidylglycerophosphate/cardiolipin synthase-like enzyme
VRGIGDVYRERLAANLTFDDPGAQLGSLAEIRNDFDHDLARLAALQTGDTAEARLQAALELLATTCSTHPHPATSGRRVRTAPSAPNSDGHATAWIGVLANQDYYQSIVALIDEAQSTIDVCMFHIACPSAEHPTRKILQALINASQRQVHVRVLMDRDRNQDPYKSTLINTPAKRLLAEAGVPVRMDKANKLLHSKFVVIDGKAVVLGSHNWSAGSYFEFDDLTLVLSASSLAAELKQRFDGMWANAR